ncbi:hypothetical protein LTR53_016045, partial [Teratosphaeriaceae sp. CCFEE 6253]
DWLSDVNNLNWDHDRAAPQPTHQPLGHDARGFQSGYRSPALPRKNSRRTPSDDFTSTQHSYGAQGSFPEHYDQHDRDVFSGFDSAPSPPANNDQHDNGFLAAPSGGYQLHDAEMARPHSFASVNHHRAADSISRNSFGANAAMRGTEAEIYGQTPPPRGGGFGER